MNWMVSSCVAWTTKRLLSSDKSWPEFFCSPQYGRSSLELAEVFHGVDGAAASRQSSVSIAGDLLVSLNNHRSERVATTLSGFPRIHWFLLDVLYLCIVLSFLVDSNQEVNQYLNSIQVSCGFGSDPSVTRTVRFT